MDEGRKPRAARRPPRPRRIDALPQRPLYRAVVPTDLYHRLLTVPWSGFFALLALAYGVFNTVFALLYLAQPGSVASAKGDFADAFFFSVQTMATIGYGEMRPATLYANVARLGRGAARPHRVRARDRRHLRARLAADGARAVQRRRRRHPPRGQAHA